jgi:hypothetical protein
MTGCPCQYVRYGAVLLTWCGYALLWPAVFFGEPSFAALRHKIETGDVFNAKGLLVLALSLGLYWVGVGLREAMNHADETDWRSVAWSAAVIALGLYAVNNGWVFKSDALMFHASRAFWLGWIAGNAVNIALQLRGVTLGNNNRTPIEQAPLFTRSRFFRQHVTPQAHVTEWLEETVSTTDTDAQPDYQPFPPAQFPPVIEHDPWGRAAPQIVYVQVSEGRFVPVQLPASASVPVSRRRR